MTSAKNSRRTRATVPTGKPAVARKANTAASKAGAPAKSATRAAKTAPVSATESANAVATSAARAKPKLVRDSFTIPKSEYSVLEGLKNRGASLTRPVKKSELLRAGIAVLAAMDDKAFLAALNSVPSLKTGRPKGA